MTQPSDQHWLFLLKDFTQAIDNGNASKKECEEMLLDILQDLFSEQISETRRLQMILFIQENVEILVPDCDSAEQAAGSLLNIFHQLQVSELAKFYLFVIQMLRFSYVSALCCLTRYLAHIIFQLTFS